MATKSVNAKICQAANTKAGFGTVVLNRYQLACETDTNMLKVGIGEGITYPAQPYAALDSPVGTTVVIMGNNLPYGYLWENGAAVSRSTYGALFAVIGTTYGAGNGSTTFNLPNSIDYFDCGTNSDSVIGTKEGQWNHTHGCGSYSTGGGAVNNNTGSWGYSAIGRDDQIGFTVGVYTFWNDGDERPISIWGINHATSNVNYQSASTNDWPALLHVRKAIKY